MHKPPRNNEVATGRRLSLNQNIALAEKHLRGALKYAEEMSDYGKPNWDGIAKHFSASLEELYKASECQHQL